MSAILKDDFGRQLSADELVLVPKEVTGDRELIESLLYVHLTTAQQARLRMDAAASWNPAYHSDFLARKLAMERAAEHRRALEALGPLDPFLEKLAKTEESHL